MFIPTPCPSTPCPPQIEIIRDPFHRLDESSIVSLSSLHRRPSASHTHTFVESKCQGWGSSASPISVSFSVFFCSINNQTENSDLALATSECDVHEATSVYETLLGAALGLLGLLLLVDLDTKVSFSESCRRDMVMELDNKNYVPVGWWCATYLGSGGLDFASTGEGWGKKILQ